MLNIERGPLCLIWQVFKGKCIRLIRRFIASVMLQLCLKLCFTKTQVQCLQWGGETFPALKKKMRSSF